MHKSTQNIPSRPFLNTQTAILAFVALSSVGAIAHASDGTIEFEGKILAATCDVEAGMNATQSGKQIKVKLPTIGAGSFSGPGSRAGLTHFSVKLKNCEASAKTVRLNFDGPPIYSYGSGAPPGVELELADASGTAVDFNTPTTFPTETLASKAAEIHYSVSYVSTAATVDAGVINASIPFTVAYD
jgi:major type 1 subunit fimbrin (pilin)